MEALAFADGAFSNKFASRRDIYGLKVPADQQYMVLH